MSDCPGCDCCVEFGVCEIRPVYSCGCECPIEVRLAPLLNLLRGTILAQRQSDGYWGAYDPLAVDGLQIPRAVLRYDAITDADGHLTNFSLNPFGAGGCPRLTSWAWRCGAFRIQETVGNLAAALSHPGFGRLLEGFVSGPGVWNLA